MSTELTPFEAELKASNDHMESMKGMHDSLGQNETMSTESKTPESDAAHQRIISDHSIAVSNEVDRMADFACTLETQRNVARADASKLREALVHAVYALDLIKTTTGLPDSLREATITKCEAAIHKWAERGGVPAKPSTELS